MDKKVVVVADPYNIGVAIAEQTCLQIYEGDVANATPAQPPAQVPINPMAPETGPSLASTLAAAKTKK